MLKKIKSSKLFTKISTFVKNHKIVSVIVVILLAVGGNYLWTKTHPVVDTKYVLSTVQKGTVVVSVSGSGTVSTENQIDLKAKASGELVKLYAVAGQKVSAGDLIASLDSRDAYISLQSAQIALNKLLEPADALSKTQADNALSQSYSDGFNNVASAFVDMPVIMQGLYDLLYKQGGYLSDQYVNYQSDVIKNLRFQANGSFGVSRTMLDSLITQYNSTSKSASSPEQIELLINNTYDTLKHISQLVKDAKNTVDALQIERNEQTSSIATSAQTNLSTWTSKINADLESVFSSKNSVAANKEALAKLIKGTDALDIESAKLSVQQKQNAYSDYFVRAPFDGTVARVPVHLLDSISNGTVIATIVTPQTYAEISLNEVDIVKVKTGQKATMTFDAINGLTTTGEVAEVDSAGTTNQGVVTYNVKIKFDSNDARVRPGMSVSASIITDVQSNVLVVPNSAIKTISGKNQIQIVVGSDKKLTQSSSGVALTQSPEVVEVETGLQNDTETEIKSGLNAGDVIIVRTINGATAAKTTASPFSIPGTGNKTSTGGAVRAISR